MLHVHDVTAKLLNRRETAESRLEEDAERANASGRPRRGSESTHNNLAVALAPQAAGGSRISDLHSFPEFAEVLFSARASVLGASSRHAPARKRLRGHVSCNTSAAIVGTLVLSVHCTKPKRASLP